MSEILSSLVKAVLVFALCVPMATLIAKAILIARWQGGYTVRRHGSLLSFLLIVGPNLVTVLWFVSAALHQSEPGEAWGVCILDHGGLKTCIDSVLLAFLLPTIVAAALTYRYQLAARGVSDGVAARYFERLTRICRGDKKLAILLLGRVNPVSAHAYPICVRGFLHPTVEITTALMDRLDDTGVKAAMLHEASHLVGYDPLRYLLASVALALNPLGFLLRPDLRRWRVCREAVCDHEAVCRSADPLSLAEAIIAASRLGQRLGSFVAGLGDTSTGVLRLRVHLLLDYAARPHSATHAWPRWVGGLIILAVFLSPHVLGVWPLDRLHETAEHLLNALGLI